MTVFRRGVKRAASFAAPALASALSVMLPSEGQAADAAPTIDPATPIATAADVDTLYVWGKRETGIGTSLSASEGVVSFGTFVDRPLLRPGELAEVIPGVAVTQHSGSGKANQYFMRGFNIDHGTDFSASFDGAPLNLRSHAHGQGYLDLNFLTPELVETVRYKKGPYAAEVGDFSAAGSAAFETFHTLPEQFATMTAGSHDFARLVAAGRLGDGYVATDLTTSDGAWERPENLKKGSLILRQTLGSWNLSALAYGARWSSTDQIPQRAVDSGLIGRLGTIDPTDGGTTSRFILAASTHRPDGFDASLYVQRYRVSLFSNFTYFLDDPVNGDQFNQAEKRWIGGGGLSKTWKSSDTLGFSLGVEGRYDDIGKIGLYRTRARQRLSTDREDSVQEGSTALWGQANWGQGPFRATLGLRADGYRVDVDSDNPSNSGRKTDGILSPKLTLAYRATDSLELYADAGRGFHSNDARGATARVAPGGAATDPVQLLVPATGGEVGARYEQPGFSASVAVWALRLASELVYTGDAGDTESTNASRRVGVEFLVNWTPTPGLNIDLSAAATRARYRGAGADDRIPNALDYVLTSGAAYRFTDRTSAEITLRRLGPAALIEDNSARSKPSTVANLLLRQKFKRFELTAEVLNLFDSKSNDITYFYTSRLEGEPAGGVDDYHFHPVEPRSGRLSLKARF
jgi:hypothetical protein